MIIGEFAALCVDCIALYSYFKMLILLPGLIMIISADSVLSFFPPTLGTVWFKMGMFGILLAFYHFRFYRGHSFIAKYTDWSLAFSKIECTSISQYLFKEKQMC